ncbi:ATP-binding protein [Streptomyces sp. NPDC002133]|uniref:ATP-binding protein n=1 Tax=Streptomyces sp. NPDC002133 TaxID=3154409 RepID=UPI003328C11A
MSAALPAQGETRKLVLSGARGAVGRCRAFSQAALADWGWLPDGGMDDDAYAWNHVPAGEVHEFDEAWESDEAWEFDEAWEWDEGHATDERRAVTEDVLMVVSELVTNACLHAGGPEELVLHCTSERLRIEVTDASPVPPHPRPHADPAVPGGHGLVVLGRLARAWGSAPHGTGKTVWAEIAAPRRV